MNFISDELLKNIGFDKTTQKSIQKSLINPIPLKKMGEPEDIAKLVVYLSDENANFITISEIVEDGGMLL